MKQTKGRIWILVIAAFMLILLGWTVWQNARVFERIDSSAKTTTMLEGKYSLDGGAWKPIDNTKPIEEHFKKAVFKGHFSKISKANRTITIRRLYRKRFSYDSHR